MRQKIHPAYIFLILFTNTGLASIAYIGNFTRMLADDFCSLYYAQRLGLLRSIWYWYLNWSGRYTAFAADWFILDLTLGPYNLHYIVPLSILLWLIMTSSILYLYFRRSGETSPVVPWTLSSLLVYLVLVLSPDIRQSVFWWNGMRSYALPVIVISFYALLYLLAVHHLKLPLTVNSILGFVLLFLSGGLSETFVVAQFVFLAVLIGFRLLKLTDGTRADLTILASSLGGTVLSLIVVISAPGNAIRQGDWPVPNATQLTVISLQSYVEYLGEFFLAPEKYLGLIGGMLAAIWIGSRYGVIRPGKAKIIPACIAGGVAVSLACIPPGVYGYFESPPPRTMIIPMFFLVTGLLCASFLLGARLAGKREWSRWQSNLLILAAALTLGISSFSLSWRLFHERADFVEFAGKWDETDAQILAAKASRMDTVTIPAMINWAGLDRPNDSPEHWATVCYSQYYGIQVLGPPYR